MSSWTPKMYDQYYAVSVATSVAYVVSALVIWQITLKTVPLAWSMQRWVVRLMVTSCLCRAAEFSMQHRSVLCAEDHGLKTASRVVIVLLQGTGFATNFAGCSLLTLFFEEVRRSISMTEHSKRQRSVARLRSAILRSLLVFSVLVLTAALLIALGPSYWDFPGSHQHDPHLHCMFWLIPTWQLGPYYLLHISSLVVVVVCFIRAASSSVLHACSQPKSYLHLRWTLALLCFGLTTIGRAAFSTVAVLTSIVDDSTPLKLMSAVRTLTIYFVGLEALPAVITIGALGEQLSFTSFNRFGTVPWALRVPVGRLIPSSYLGQGAFGLVYSASLYGRMVAVKRLKTLAFQSTVEVRRLTDALECEATLLSQLQHPNVVRFIGLAFEDHLTEGVYLPMIVTELLPQGTLHALLCGQSGRQPLPWGRRLELAKHLTAGVQYLHSRSPPVIHRDLKPGAWTGFSPLPERVRTAGAWIRHGWRLRAAQHGVFESRPDRELSD